MHICIVGTGAAGLMAAGVLSKKDYVKKITLIGSDKIPTIGVGESTTLNFEEVNKIFVNDYSELVRESDAALKYGVYYQNWNEGKGWINYFKSDHQTEMNGISMWDYHVLLGNLPKNTYIHDICAKKLFNHATNNQVVVNRPEYQDTDYPTSWHFDAGKYISYILNLHKKNPKINVSSDTVVDCKFKYQNNIRSISKIILESGNVVEADYYIISTGGSKINENIFKHDYHSLSDILITDRALFLPLEYTNKKNQFHPYTIAKTMNCGWRWITPTYSRIGTGYVFSSKHISDEDAVKEFLGDIRDSSLTPNIVNFTPKHTKDSFRSNSLTLGMSSGFLEPLDAPGLLVTCMVILHISELLDFKDVRNQITEDLHNPNNLWNSILVKHENSMVNTFYKFWSTFIFAQYKNCHRRDTEFWKDYSCIENSHYNEVIDQLWNGHYWDYHGLPPYVFNQTLAARHISWETKTNELPFLLQERDAKTIHHLDFINGVRDGVLLI